jgi:ABC-type polysaccharide/polyol phosphate export permease
VAFNPMNTLIASFRDAVLGGSIDGQALGIASGVVVASFLASCFYFRRVEDDFADII